MKIQPQPPQIYSSRPQLDSAAQSGKNPSADAAQVLQGDSKAMVDETEVKTFAALAKIAPGSREGTAQAVLGAAERYSNAEDMSVKVRTREGDEVTISFSRNQSYAASYATGADSKGNSVAWMDVSRSESSQYQFSVQGHLNEGEITALQQMVRDITGVANEFFNGDVQKAFEQSGDISFDASKLSSMQLNMSYTRTLAQVASYEQIGSLSQPVDKPGLRLGQMMKELADSAGASSLGFLQSPAQAGRDLMTGLVEQDSRFADAMKELQDSYRNNLKQLLDAVLPLNAEPASAPPPRQADRPIRADVFRQLIA